MTDNWAAGRVALITGATSGFGEALARRIVGGGGRVIATGRREDRLKALAQDLGERLLPKALDIRIPNSIAWALSNLPDDFSAIDVLFNNAGLALGLAKAQEVDIADWEQMIETNVLGLARITRAVLPGMVERS